MKKTFHCRKVNGDPDFSIDEWNKVFKDPNLTEEQKEYILDDTTPCEKQCFDCMADVGKTRIKTKEIIRKINQPPT